jgi:hypothetical protein
VVRLSGAAGVVGAAARLRTLELQQEQARLQLRRPLDLSLRQLRCR